MPSPTPLPLCFVQGKAVFKTSSRLACREPISAQTIQHPPVQPTSNPGPAQRPPHAPARFWLKKGIINDHHHCLRPQLSSGQQMPNITHRTKQYILSSTINITLLLFMITIIAFAPSYPWANKCPALHTEQSNIYYQTQ